MVTGWAAAGPTQSSSTWKITPAGEGTWAPKTLAFMFNNTHRISKDMGPLTGAPRGRELNKHRGIPHRDYQARGSSDSRGVQPAWLLAAASA